MQTFEVDYGVPFVHVRISDMVEDMMFSNVSAANSTAPYVRYITVVKMVINYRGELPPYERLGNEVSAAKTLGISHFDDRSLYVSSQENIILIVLVAHAFDKSEHRRVSIHVSSFCRLVRVLVNELHARQLQKDEKKFLFFALFLIP